MTVECQITFIRVWMIEANTFPKFSRSKKRTSVLVQQFKELLANYLVFFNASVPNALLFRGQDVRIIMGILRVR
jgi:hypothetical protein